MERNILCNFKSLGAVEVKLKKGEVYPAHDHPDKTVFCYLACGKIRIESFDVVGQEGEIFKLKKVEDITVTPGDNATLTPDERNLHRVSALEDSTFVDTYTPNCPEIDGLNFYKLTELSDVDFEAKHITLEQAFSE